MDNYMEVYRILKEENIHPLFLVKGSYMGHLYLTNMGHCVFILQVLVLNYHLTIYRVGLPYFLKHRPIPPASPPKPSNVEE